MKSQNPWMGRAKGSAGGMTASKVYDKNVLKAKAFEVNNPNTAAQQNQRTFFKEVSDLVSQLTVEQCRFLCPKAPKGMSRRNFLSKQLASYVTTSSNQKIVDLENVKTLGNAKEHELPIIGSGVDGGGISLSWEMTTEFYEKYGDTYPTFLLINKQQKQLQLVNSSDDWNSDNTLISAPSNWEEGADIFALPFIVLTKTPLTGFGTMVVSERPAK